MAILEFTAQGIYCPKADVYLDPWKPVHKALITHGHSDHARWGHQHYLCTTSAAPVIRHRLKLTDNTIVVLWGDHGWHLGDHGMWCKHTNYEQATRAPLFCAAPGQPGGQRVKDIVEFVDIYPTLCDLAGLERPGHLQGDSLAELVRGRPAPKTQPQTDNLALHVYPRANKETGPLLGQALRSNRWRYVEWQQENGKVAARELYDLENDPGETVNLAEDPQQAEVISQHAALLAAQLAKPDPAGVRGK